MAIKNSSNTPEEMKTLQQTRHFETIFNRLRSIREDLGFSHERLATMVDRVNAPQEGTQGIPDGPGRPDECGLYHMYQSELDELSAISHALAARIYELEQSI